MLNSIFFKNKSVCIGLGLYVLSGILVAEPIVESRNGSGHSSTRSTSRMYTQQPTLSIPQIEALEQEIRELRGQLEEQQHALKRLTKSQQDLYLDLERKLQNKSTVPAPKPVSISIAPKKDKVSVNPVTPVAPVKPLYQSPIVTETEAETEIETEIETEQETAVNTEINIEKPLPEAMPLAALPLEVKPTVVIKGTLAEKNVYENAYNFVLNKRYAEAVVALQDFLNQYPKGQYAPNAHYWLGEVYSLQGRSEKNTDLLNKASVEFIAITTQFPNHQKAMDALLKLGIIEGDKGNTEAARQYLTHVKERYPGTSVARIATTHLQRLK